MLKHKVQLNEKEMYYYRDILNNVKGTGYDEKCIVADVAERVGYLECAYGIYDAKIIKENEVYYATWGSGSSAD